MTGEFTVYLVDDDTGVRKGLSRLLRARGYDVRPCSSPEEFLQQHDAQLALVLVRQQGEMAEVVGHRDHRITRVGTGQT